MAATIVSTQLLDEHGVVGKGVCIYPETLSVELRSPSEAFRLAKILHKWADFVEEQTRNPDSLKTWAREER